MNLKEHLAQVEITKALLLKLSDEDTETLTKWLDEVRKTEPEFELTDFIHSSKLPMSYDMFHLFMGRVMDAKAYLNAGSAIIVVNNNSGQWLVNLEDPRGINK